MSDDLKNILNNSNKDIDNQHLMDYLSQQLSKQESHDLEKMMLDDPFVNDAVEGLEQLPGKKSMAISVEQLNRDLQKQLAKKKNRKEKRKLKEQPWVYFAIILLLILTIVCYFMVKKYMESKDITPGKPATVQLTINTLNY
jgi:cytochrome c-type biogenesis protein CcmH/NrfG